MSFLIYFFVLLISAASVLFGLDLMSSPLATTPNVPLGRVQAVSKPLPQQAKQQVEAHQAKQHIAANTQADNHDLTPVYPASPATPQHATPVTEQPQSTGSTPRETAAFALPPKQDAVQPEKQAEKAASTPPAVAQQPAQQAVAQQPAQPAAVAPQQPAPAQQASVTPQAGEQTAQAQPAVQQTSGKCNVQACSASYQSFRASDCTYQPFDGPRRLCTRNGTDTVARARASQPRQLRDDNRRGAFDEAEGDRYTPAGLRPRGERAHSEELNAVERIVRHIAPDDDDEDEVPVRRSDRRVFIFPRAYSYR